MQIKTFRREKNQGEGTVDKSKGAFKRTFRKRGPLLIVAISVLLGIVVESCRNNQSDTTSYIQTLDSLLSRSDDFTRQRLANIEELKVKFNEAGNAEDRYVYSNMLVENYFTLSADSALRYTEESLRIAENEGDKSKMTRALINKGTLLAASGLLLQALATVDSIHPAELAENEIVDYYALRIYVYGHLRSYVQGEDNEYYRLERLYKDSLMSVISPGHPEYLLYKGWAILGTEENPEKVIKALREKINSDSLSEYQKARGAFVLARLYENQGDRENFEKYMTLSAIIDIKTANSATSSLRDLATIVFKDGSGDVDRANSYIRYSLNKALDYPNRAKAFGISKALDSINTEYQARLVRQQHRTILFLVLVCVLAGVLIVAIVAIIRQNKKLGRQREEVDRMNRQLNQKVVELSDAEGKLNEMNNLLKHLNEDLKEKNEALYEANFVKEEYIGYVFNLCSSYIAKIEDLKRNIYLKTLKKQYKEIEAETNNIDIKDELKDFYHSFDSIFLTIYPDFVKDFNSLLLPEKQVVVKEGELLNMELRIYALMRLGITDSAKIAEFLHCAPQTIYNYRLRTRSRSIYSSREEFMERFKTLGSFEGGTSLEKKEGE